MLQRIQLVLLVALVLAVATMFWRSRAAQAASREQVEILRAQIAHLSSTVGRKDDASRLPAPKAASSWLAALQAAGNWRDAARIAEDLARLPPADSTSILNEIFSHVESPETRQQVLKAFALHGGKSNALAILELGLFDDDAQVRKWATEYMESYAWRAFAPEHDAIFWCVDNVNARIETVLERSIAAFFAAAAGHTGAAVDNDLELLLTIDPRVLQEHGSERTVRDARHALAAWITSHSNAWDARMRERACGAAQRFGVEIERLPAEIRAFAPQRGVPR
jgi:hypothetical protein